jgi:hypothetical protein
MNPSDGDRSRSPAGIANTRIFNEPLAKREAG